MGCVQAAADDAHHDGSLLGSRANVSYVGWLTLASEHGLFVVSKRCSMNSLHFELSSSSQQAEQSVGEWCSLVCFLFGLVPCSARVVQKSAAVFMVEPVLPA